MSYIDTRDLAAELDELEARQDAVNAAGADDATDEDRADLEPLDEDEAERLRALRDLRDEIGSEWSYGETMIPVEDFEDYAQELADDIGAWPHPEASWPLTHIDWAAAARKLAHDYTQVEWEGRSYYVRTS